MISAFTSTPCVRSNRLMQSTDEVDHKQVALPRTDARAPADSAGEALVEAYTFRLQKTPLTPFRPKHRGALSFVDWIW